MTEPLHPIVQQMEPSAEQLGPVVTRDLDVVVTAGAGTGKTRTLVARFLSLLAEGEPLRSIAAITFTVKAAREMRNRLREEIRRYLERSDLEGAERERWSALYGELDAARVSTIHSLCAEFLRTHPAEIGVDPRFETLDEGAASVLQVQAVQSALDWAAQQRETVILFNSFNIWALERMVAALLEKRVDTEQAWPGSAGDLWSRWREVLLEPIRGFMDDPEVQQGFAALLGAREAGIVAQAAEAGDALVDNLRKVLRHWEAAWDEREKGRWREVSRHLAPLRRALKQKGRKSNWEPMEPKKIISRLQDLYDHYLEVYDREHLDLALDRKLAEEVLPQLEAVLQEAGERYALVDNLRKVLRHWEAAWDEREKGRWREVSRHLAPLRRALKQKGRKSNWEPMEPKKIISRLQDLYDHYLEVYDREHLDLALDRKLAEEVLPQLEAVLQEAGERYAREKAQRRALDYDDLEARALQLLREHPEARSYWQEEIQSLLVDEFQDTNARQRDLLSLLNGGEGKLFLVGDGKQSIYRFRGADVSVFREEKQAVGRRGRAFQLATSYRAHAGLVRTLNQLLAPVLGEADPQKPYREPFAPLTPSREEPSPGFRSPYVEFHLTVGRKSTGALDQAAAAAAARILELVEDQDIRVPREGGAGFRALSFSDVAILCRASRSFSAYEGALEGQGVPYLTISGSGFYDRPEVRDALNMLAAAADPGDDLSLAGALRSPAGGLSDLALYRLRAHQKELALPSLYAALQEGDLSYLGEEGSAARQAQGLIADLHNLVGRKTVAEVLEAFLERSGYRVGLARAGCARCVNNLAKLQADAQASGLVSVSRFLEYVQQLRDVAVREGEAQAVAEGAVQLMTVHQAKGLEFPVVVIGDASRRAPGPRGVLLDDQLGVVPPYSREEIIETPGGKVEKREIKAGVYRWAQDREGAREEAESARLLYVAATRAQELLLVSGCVRSVNQDGTLSKPGGWLHLLGEPLGLNQIPVEFSWSGRGVSRLDLARAEEPVLVQIYQPDWQPDRREIVPQRRPDRQPPADTRLLEPVVEPSPEPEGEEERQFWRVVPEEGRWGLPAWVIGELVHRALERWFFPGGERDFSRWAAVQLQGLGVLEERLIRRGIDRASRMLDRFQRSDRFQELEKAEIRRAETPFSMLDAEGRLVSGRMDILYRFQGEWKILEFKTDRVDHPRELPQVMVEGGYQRQVRAYQEAARKLLGEKPPAWLVFLDVAQRLREHQVGEEGR